MSRMRVFVPSLVALVLLLQGFAVAAAPVSVHPEPPCAGMPADEGAMPCCDSTCPDMASCMFGAVVPAPYFAAQFGDTAQQPEASAPAFALSSPPQGFFRPPISLHA